MTKIDPCQHEAVVLNLREVPEVRRVATDLVWDSAIVRGPVVSHEGQPQVAVDESDGTDFHDTHELPGVAEEQPHNNMTGSQRLGQDVQAEVDPFEDG